MTTYSRESEWSNVLGPVVGISHRSTTSSRRPGKAIEGSVHYEIKSVVVCPTCNGLRRMSSGPHAPHWHNGVMVDCIGKPVMP